MPLSSSLTHIIRTLLPRGWAILLLVVVAIPARDDFKPLKWFVVAGLVLLLIEAAAWYTRLKDVYADADGLVISDRRASSQIPWSQVAGIRKTWWGKVHFARLDFQTPTPLGRSILFMMKFDPLAPWNNQPSVRAVRDYMAAAAGAPLPGALRVSPPAPR